ncbi:hypothetical protein EDC44_11023 [Cricetibacter osteomyelitidis]|uniref:Smf/DprA SLOG domain-containing protein n=1 Tax=Cricetibacter osteomyelitidis TaxID=1521931 RepID=A0A4R2TK22_9PAST|nr:hypothetical protein [Cricetibacter osteomyelitidis]TCP95192.1 hypothetical protein EDC44_11023 [Cricetibacter osteomyelitidis]
MCTIFFSGSRSISKLNKKISERISNNILNKGFSIVVGDANGIDKAIQKLLLNKSYKNVIIFCSGNTCRNNLGNWKSENIETDAKGREFFEAKDKKMADIADYGFVIWDGKSIGSLNNIAELLQRDKSSLVYFKPKDEFISISSEENLRNLLDINSNQINNKIKNKGSIYLKKIIAPQIRLF